jgi:hypothetical protein
MWTVCCRDFFGLRANDKEFCESRKNELWLCVGSFELRLCCFLGEFFGEYLANILLNIFVELLWGG